MRILRKENVEIIEEKKDGKLELRIDKGEDLIVDGEGKKNLKKLEGIIVGKEKKELKKRLDEEIGKNGMYMRKK